MALSIRNLSFLRRLAAKGDVYAVGILEAVKGEMGAGGGRVEKILTNPAATSANNCVASTAASAANALTLADATPDFPRNVTATFAALWDGGDIVLVGLDHTGAPATETLASNAGSTRAGVVAWKSITSASKTVVGATANAVTLGYTNVFGIGAKPLVAGSQLCFHDGVGEASTLDATNGTIAPTTAPNGTVDYVLSAVKA